MMAAQRMTSLILYTLGCLRDILWILMIMVPFTVTDIFFRHRLKNLKGQVILVSGSAQGLGKALALQLGTMGAYVVCVDILEQLNQQTLREIESCGGTGAAYTCDVSCPQQVRYLAQQITSTTGRVDILINNAGLVFRNRILTQTDEDIKRVVDVNLLSQIWMLRAFLPMMIKAGKGHVVLISSLSALHGLANGVVYSSTKGAILGLTAALKEEFADNTEYKHIKLTCMLPGFMDTGSSVMFSSRLSVMKTEDAAQNIIASVRKEFLIATVPGGRFGYFFYSILRYDDVEWFESRDL